MSVLYKNASNVRFVLFRKNSNRAWLNEALRAYPHRAKVKAKINYYIDVLMARHWSESDFAYTLLLIGQTRPIESENLFRLVWVYLNPYPADQNFRLLHLPPNSTEVLFHIFIHTLPTVTKLYPTISSYTGCQTYQKSHIIFFVFICNFLHNFQS